MTEFYAVSWGKKKGVFESWDECKASIDGFPQPVFKKFDTREEAKRFVNEQKPEHVDLEVEDKTLDKYYSVARGTVVGIFTNYDQVKEHIVNYQKPYFKKHNSYAEALKHFNKFNKGQEGDDTTEADHGDAESDQNSDSAQDSESGEDEGDVYEESEEEEDDESPAKPSRSEAQKPATRPTAGNVRPSNSSSGASPAKKKKLK